MLQWKKECFFFYHIELNTTFIVMAIDEVTLNLSFLLVETLPFRLEILLWHFHSLQFLPALKWVHGIRNLSPTILLHHLQLGMYIRLLVSPILLLRWFVEDKFLMHPNFQFFQVSKIRISPFHYLSAINAYPSKIPGNIFFPNWWSLAWSRVTMGWYSTNAPNGIMGPLIGSPNRLS